MITKIEGLLINQRFLIGVSLSLIFVYFFPFLYYGADSHILIHDNLDSNLTWVKALLDSGDFFSSPDKDVPNVFNGIPRSSLYGVYDISLVWFKLFGMYYGYIVNKIIMSLVAFMGMYYLLKKIIQPVQSLQFVLVGVALLFSLLPFWSFTLSVCGLPLVLYAFLNIREKKKHFINWLIIIVFPFYSSLVLSGIFFLVILGMILMYDIYKNKKINFYFVLGIGVFVSAYLLSHYLLFYSFLFNNDHVSHRVEIILAELTTKQSYDKTESMLRFGQYHAHSLHKYILYPILIVVLVQIFTKRVNKIAIAIVIFMIVSSLIYGFLYWEKMVTLSREIMSVIPIQVDRFHFLHPMFWYVLLGISLTFIARYLKFGKLLVAVVILLQLLFIVDSHDFRTQKNVPSYRQFYAEELFTEIKSFINEPQDSYRVISLGIHPGIALYNGFYTLDGYFADYPLSYKHDFRKVISKELDKSAVLQKYFDNWGSRCYAFSAELGRGYLNQNPKKVKNLEFDFGALRKLGGKYILSSAEINTGKIQDIKFVKTFEHPDSRWKIHVYEVTPE
ncbi:DUF6044 family protein [Aquimarina aggregata]|uniref:DUF6044 family protein n=1 Tax=Aquimarina aggregata TaxID=1642818 RepID=UPI00248FA4C9|nr:DUF6044 family protein [Aquimarina aggregata]